MKGARDFLASIREASPSSEITYLFGNHEFRFEIFISTKAKELEGLNGLTLEEQLDLKQLNIIPVNTHQRESFVRYGKLLIGHFNQVRKHSGYTARGLLEDKGLSLIQNHTHRGGSSYKRDFSDNKVAYENFCLCNLNPPYCQLPNWQLGFSTIHKDTKSDFFKVTPVEIVKYRILYGNRIYQ